MRTLILFSFVLFTSLFSFSQQRVALHSSGTTTIFSGSQPFIDAYAASVNGDTIYLPGGNFASLTISKRLTIIGAGIYNDSTSATMKTNISSTLYLDAGADNTHIEGLYINGSIQFGTDVKIDSILIRRNYLTGISIPGTSTSTDCNAIRIEENVINGSIDARHTSNIKIFNNILRSISYIDDNGWVANNIFYYTGSGNPLSYIYNSLIENNYFQTGWGISSCEYNLFQNNTWDTDQSGEANNTHLNEYYSINTATMFVNFGVSSTFQVSDYHLNAPMTYLGSDGSQVGLYGGYTPVKDGWLPFNPHIRTITIAPNTNPTGQLNVQIEVGAQNN